MVKLIDANAFIRFVKAQKDHPHILYTTDTMVLWINLQPHILIDKVNTLDDVKQRGVFVARKEKK